MSGVTLEALEALVSAYSGAAEVLRVEFVTALAERHSTDPFGSEAITSLYVDSHTLVEKCARLSEEYARFVGSSVRDGQWISHPGIGGHPFSFARVVWSILEFVAASTFWKYGTLDPLLFTSVTQTTVRDFAAWLSNINHEFEVVEAVGLHNVYLGSDLKVDTSVGTLQAAPHGPSMPNVYLSGPLQLTLDVGGWHDAPSAFLLRTERAQATVTDQPTEGGEYAPVFPDTADECVRAAAIGIVLGAGHHDHSAPVFGGSRLAHPVVGHINSGTLSRTGRRDPGIPVVRQNADIVREYINLAHESTMTASLAFASRRFLAALNSSNAEEALVDAVVVWECLFSGTPETGLRVTGSVARTLAHEFKDNTTLIDFRSRLSKIYNIRSAIVHGNVQALVKNEKEMHNYARNAKRYAIRLLRQAYRWDIDLRTLDSLKRSERALFDPDWPPNRT